MKQNGSKFHKDIPVSQKCDGKVDCPGTMADEDPQICKAKGRHICTTADAGGLVNIPDEEVCDGIGQCSDFSDDNPTRCPDRFPCTSVDGKRVNNNLP